MTDDIFLENYFLNLKNLITENTDKLDKLIKVKKLLLSTREKNKKILIFGNGGSAAIASHFSVDLTKNAKVRCVNFNESDLLTCFSNDFGYEKWVEKCIEFYADYGDMVILISASGESKNMLNAVKAAKRKDCKGRKRDQGFPEVLTLRIPVSSSPLRRARYSAEILRALAWSASS